MTRQAVAGGRRSVGQGKVVGGPGTVAYYYRVGLENYSPAYSVRVHLSGCAADMAN